MKIYNKATFYKKLNDSSNTVTTSEAPVDMYRLYEAINNTDHKRNRNYQIDEEFKSNTICYSLTYIEDNFPALASVAWSKPMYNGIIRLTTRYCIHPLLIDKNFGKGIDSMRIDTIDHILQQIAFCKKLGHEDFFIGREDKSKGRRTKQICKNISEYTFSEWKVSSDPVLIANNPNNSSCWQYIIYNNRKDFNYENICNRPY